ncbi:Ig-like domain-containing protein [Leifsonia sp. Le1]|uniref:COG1361 S-layer family protein n=1 Tax=Leifsonia sp. Le1 TaxID=3404918 RepID=UPI003EBA6FD9
MRWPGRTAATTVVLAVVAATISAGWVSIGSAETAQAAPGTPGTAQAPTVAFQENFENGVGNTPVALTAYTGASGQKYTADPAWLANCNGQVRNFNTPSTTLGNCQIENDSAHLNQLAYALGAHAGSATPGANHAVTAYTENNPGVNATEFQTATNIPLASSSGRFLTFSVDTAAVNCNASAPLYQFAFLNQAGTATNVGGQLNACSSGKTVNVPANGSLGAATVNVGTYTSNGSLLFTGSTLGIRMQNANGSGAGNDAAFDNIRILDVTPQLDKAFSPTAVQTGGTSTLTFTVTNTSELASKAGWGFTDALPAGLTLANSTVGGTCNATTTAVAGATSVAITNGTLAAGQTSCTITVQVTSPVAGSFTNGPDNVTTVGLNEPGTSTVTFSDPSYTVSKTASTTVVNPGGLVTYTVNVKNTGAWAYTAAKPASFTDDLSKVLDDATITSGPSNGATVNGNTLTWSGPLAVGATQTITYTVTVGAPDPGDGVLTNAVVPGGGGTCDPAGSCTTTTTVQSFSVTKKADKTDVVPGQTINYTITVKNTGQLDYTAAAPASFTDDLTAVLDDATYNNDATSGATYAAPTLSWSGALAVGQSVTITYSVTVDDPIAGDSHIDNAVVTPPGGDCPAGSTNPDCIVLIPSGSFTVAKTSSTTEVTAGGTVTYQVTVKNTGVRDYTAALPAGFTDDLSRVLDDATVTAGPDNGATITGNTLSWSGPLAVGATVVVTYTVTVNNPDTGDKVLTNTVRPEGPGGSCDPAGECTTTTDVRVFTVSKTSSPAGAVKQGDTVTYTVTVTNEGTADFTAANPASFTDDLSAVLDDATYNGDASNGATYVAPTLSWSGALAAGKSVTVTYTATVNTPDTGDHKLTNAVVPDGGGSCVPGECATTNPVQSYSVTKTSSAAGEVHPGDTITYTVTVTNTGQADYTAAVPATITDDLSKVLDDATYVAGSATAGAVVSGNTLTWSGPLAVGAVQAITYQVLVGPAGTGDGVLTNAVIGGDCDPAGSCTTTNPVQAFSVTKTADKTEVVPGDTVTYTITVKNTGTADYTAANPASFSDDLSAVLDDASYNNDATGGATYAAPTLSWSGALAAGATVTVTYSLTVNDPASGDKQMDNTVVTPPNIGGDCPTGADNAACTVNIPSGSFTITKSADKSTVVPGGTITYTVTVTNTGKVDYTAAKPASFTDDLTNVLDDATYNGDASNGATYAAPTLAWSGALAAGQTVKVTYSVTVNNPNTGNHHLVNAVIPTGPGGVCDPAGTCLTNTPVGSYTVTKSVSTTNAVKPGAKVVYTITVVNTGQFAYTSATPAKFTDTMTDVLDDATYNGDATHGATLNGNILSWAGPLDVGETVTVTYSVTVKNPDTGNGRLINKVDPPVDGGGACDPAGSCDTNTPIVPPAPGTGLAFTGSDIVAPGILALLLVGAGATFLVIRRRRATE